MTNWQVRGAAGLEVFGFKTVIELPEGTVSPCWASPFWQLPQKEPKGLAPASGPGCAGVRSLYRRSEGRRTRAIHGPLRLSPHPCGSPLCATIPFTLLMGRFASSDVSRRLIVRPKKSKPRAQEQKSKRAKETSRRLGLLLLQEAERRRCTGVDTERVTKGRRPQTGTFLRQGLFSSSVPRASSRAPVVYQQPNHQTTPNAPSEGRMESLRRGASGMDAARAVKGHGWPLRGDPRSSDGMKGSRAQRDPNAGASVFAYFFRV